MRARFCQAMKPSLQPLGHRKQSSSNNRRWAISYYFLQYITIYTHYNTLLSKTHHNTLLSKTHYITLLPNTY
ncbi:hypothetical protein BLOT_010423 [Blomia tropicalis]|nr:hypothetical protein BLOT_010423 [Blomia tropicalis]